MSLILSVEEKNWKHYSTKTSIKYLGRKPPLHRTPILIQATLQFLHLQQKTLLLLKTFVVFCASPIMTGDRFQNEGAGLLKSLMRSEIVATAACDSEHSPSQCRASLVLITAQLPLPSESTLGHTLKFITILQIKQISKP